jgi:translation elongation factor EF-1alpha
MEMDFTKYSVEELRELQNKIGNYIQNLNDGFVYICQVRSYGNNWKKVLTNERAVNDLCEQYDGYDGIVDVYTTNPDAKIDNYGEVNYIKSEEDYLKWYDGETLVSIIKSAEDKLEKWNDRDNIPFHSRPSVVPMWIEEDILEWKSKLETIGVYEKPTSIKISEDYD